MSALAKPPRYQAYVLRCWEERRQTPDCPGVWRFSLEDTRTGQRHGFGDLERLVALLRAELMDVPSKAGLEDN